MTGPYESTPDDLEITHEYGEDVVQDVVSTYAYQIGPPLGGDVVPFPIPETIGFPGGNGQPQTVTVRKPRP
jgi:hypothetical protein